MTPDDKRRLAHIRELQKAEEVGHWYSAGHHTTGFLLRLLDEATAEAQQRRLDLSAVRLMNEAIAERDAAVAALREASREGFFLCRQKAENTVIESPMRDHERRLLRHKIGTLAYPDPVGVEHGH